MKAANKEPVMQRIALAPAFLMVALPAHAADPEANKKAVLISTTRH
jgi:hypothetical protein